MGRKASYDRDDILNRALIIFWTKGFRATSLKDLEVALNLRPGSIYSGFGSKEKLFSEALNLYSMTSKERFRAKIKAAPSALSGLAGYVRDIGKTGRTSAPAQACMLLKTLLETPDDDPTIRQLTETLLGEMEAEFAAAFKNAIATGELSENADPEHLASRLQIALFGLRSYAQRNGTQERVAKLANEIADDLENLSGAKRLH